MCSFSLLIYCVPNKLQYIKKIDISKFEKANMRIKKERKQKKQIVKCIEQTISNQNNH